MWTEMETLLVMPLPQVLVLFFLLLPPLELVASAISASFVTSSVSISS